MKYEIISYDVWGNSREGFVVNAAFNTGIEVEIDDPWTASDYSINRKIGVRGVTYDGDPEHGLYAENKRNGRPEFELQPK